MARQLLLMRLPESASQAGLAAATLLLFAFALFMCASHSRKWRRLSACYGLHNENPVIQLNTDAMIVTTKRVHGIQPGNGEESMFSGEDRVVSVWQKNILMGEKCQLPDFSGVIVYDSTGNIISPTKPSLAVLSWK